MLQSIHTALPVHIRPAPICRPEKCSQSKPPRILHDIFYIIKVSGYFVKTEKRIFITKKECSGRRERSRSTGVSLRRFPAFFQSRPRFSRSRSLYIISRKIHFTKPPPLAGLIYRITANTISAPYIRSIMIPSIRLITFPLTENRNTKILIPISITISYMDAALTPMG